MFDLQFFQHMRDRRGSDHLVLDAVPQIGLVDVHGKPAHDIFNGRFGEDIGDAVRHSQIGAHGTVEYGFGGEPIIADGGEDAENVRRGAADIDAEDIDVLTSGDGLHDLPYRSRCRHDRCTCPAHQFPITGCLGHHVLEKQIVDDMARRSQILLLENGADVLRQM